MARLGGLGTSEALIRHWLHVEPAADWDEWVNQVAQSLWLEKRHLKALAGLQGTKVA